MQPKENILLTVLDNALEQAVRDLGLDWQYATKTKRQKYGWLAVDYFSDPNDYPITFSWYQYGVSMPNAPASNEAWGGTHSHTSLPQNENPLYGLDREEVIQFYKLGLGEMDLESNWYTNNFDFLETFYTHHAPEEYRELYLKNIDLRRIFAEAKNRIDRAHMQEPIREYEHIGRVTTTMEFEMANHEMFDEVSGKFLDYTLLLEDAFMMLEKIGADQFTDEHLSVVISLQSFYKEYAWKLPALLISKATAVGPNSEEVISWADDGLKTILKQYDTELEKRRKECDAAGLLPSSTDYSTYDDEASEVLSGLVSDLNGE